MAAASYALSPLHTVTNGQLQKLGQVVWDWQLCGSCLDEIECTRPECPWSRAKRLKTFWSRYKDLAEAYVPEFADISQPILSSHEDVFRIIRTLRDERSSTREDLVLKVFSNVSGNGTSWAVEADRKRAMNIAVSVLLMTNCGTPSDCADFLEEGGSSISWRDNLTATEFVLEAFPTRIHPYFEYHSKEAKSAQVMDALAATRLLETGLSIEPTNDLRSHLTLDFNGKKKVVRVFQCSAVLKESLLASQIDATSCLLPRPLALEVLDTIYQVLFPSNKSTYALLSSLVRKNGFDPDMLQYEWTRYRREDDPEVTYAYFGVRLAELYDELQAPIPRYSWERKLQKYSAQRFMLMATMIGVFIAVVIGILGLGISGFQAYVSWQQWKHPVKDT
jgi:hypothetical protein